MNGSSFLADTNILLYILKGDRIIGDLVKGNQISISFISELELLSFKQITSAEEYAIKSLLQYSTIIGWNQQIQEQAIVIRRKTGLKIPDSIILATATT